MSHSTTVKTKIKNRESLINGLKKLGITYKEGNLKTKGSYQVHNNVDISLTSWNGRDLKDAVGFKQQADGSYSATGDFYMLKDGNGNHITQKEMVDKINEAYNFEEVNGQLENLGFTVQENVDLTKSGNGVEYVMQRIVP